AVSQLLPARSIHLRIVPRPANLSESREIFRVLRRFGEISVFKYLRYEYHNPADNIALAIFRDATSAQKALDASPIRFALEKVIQPANDQESTQSQSQPGTEEDEDDQEADPFHSPKFPAKHGIDEMLRPSDLLSRTDPPSTTTPPSPQRQQPPMPFDPPNPPPHSPLPRTHTKWFQVTIDHAHAVLQDHIERQPFWKQYTPMKSMAQEDLAPRVPHVGLSDISKRPMNAHRTPNKVLRQMSEYVERAMPSLRGMKGNDVGEVRFRERRG
ncbi:hypothetical protein GQ44DRAFT_577069, partial [Phaeosphaeriaceae sp. PMI808]